MRVLGISLQFEAVVLPVGKGHRILDPMVHASDFHISLQDRRSVGDRRQETQIDFHWARSLWRSRVEPHATQPTMRQQAAASPSPALSCALIVEPRHAYVALAGTADGFVMPRIHVAD